MHSKYFLISRRYLSSVPRDLRMPTPLSRGHGLKYRKNESTDKPKRLAVVVGWMGAKDSQMKSYLSFYHHHGYDTLSFAVGPRHVLFPQEAMSFMETVLTTALEVSKEYETPTTGSSGQTHSSSAPSHTADDGTFSNNTHISTTSSTGDHVDIVFHSFSMGGYLFGQSLRAIANNGQKYRSMQDRIKAQIFDSPPDRNSIACGISKSVGMGPLVENIVENLANIFLKITANTSGVEHRAASEAFHDNYLKAPSLWYYSYADPISRHEDCDTVIKKWQKKGTHVEVCTWDDTPHIQHGRVYPEKYFGELETFLRKFQLLDTTTTAAAAAVNVSANTKQTGAK